MKVFAVAMSPKIGDGFYVKTLCPRKFSGTDVRDSAMSPIVITALPRLANLLTKRRIKYGVTESVRVRDRLTLGVMVRCRVRVSF